MEFRTADNIARTRPALRNQRVSDRSCTRGFALDHRRVALMTKLLVGVATALAVGVLSALPATAYPVFWTDSTKTTPLRDQKASAFAPDALEFTNQGPDTLS